jgi:hypothetical protein
VLNAAMCGRVKHGGSVLLGTVRAHNDDQFGLVDLEFTLGKLTIGAN